MMRYIKEMRELEDDDVRRVTRENFSILLRASNTLSSLDEGWIVLSFFHSIAFNACVYSYLYLFFITCYLLRDDFVLVGVQFHYLLLALFGAVFQFHLYSRRRQFCVVAKIMAFGFYKYEDEEDWLVKEKVEFSKFLIKQRLLLIPFLVLIGMIGMFISVFGPLIDNMVGAGHDGDYINGVYMKTPIPMYFPFEIDNVVSHLAAVGFQVVTVVMLALSICGVIFINIVTLQNLAYQFRILNISLKKLYIRSAARYLKNHPNRTIDKRTKESEEFQNCISSCLKENVKHHQVLREYYRVQAQVIGVPLLAAFLMGTFIIALSMMILNEKTDRIGLLLTNTLAMIGEVGNIYIACYFGEEILSLSEELFVTIYSIKWYTMNQHNKKILMLFQDSTRNPMVVKASLIFTCSMDTFSSIINSAYSYFNMLSASSSSKKD